MITPRGCRAISTSGSGRLGPDVPETYVYVHGTCGGCGYEGGLVIASTSDPRCWPCEDWAEKSVILVRHLARAHELAKEVLALAPASLNADPITLTQMQANDQSWRPMCRGLTGGGRYDCFNRSVSDDGLCLRHHG